MAKRRPPSFRHVDVADLITLICGYREEAFPFERPLALLTFGLWALWPNQPEIVQHGRLVGAAMLLRLAQQGALAADEQDRQARIETFWNQAMRPEEVTEALIDPPLLGPFRESVELQEDELWYASETAFFLVRCPEELHPSINKAQFFSDEGGFENKISISSMKTYWARFAVATPFMVAQEYKEVQLIGLPPDDPKAVLKAVKLSQSVDRLRDLFGAAKYIQGIILKRLEPSARRRVRFTFPDAVKEHPIEIEPLEEDQIEIVRRYRAPKSI